MSGSRRRSRRTQPTAADKGALQTVTAFLPLLIPHMSCETGCRTLLDCIAAQQVGNRPDRWASPCESRASYQQRLAQLLTGENAAPFGVDLGLPDIRSGYGGFDPPGDGRPIGLLK